MKKQSTIYHSPFKLILAVTVVALFVTLFLAVRHSEGGYDPNPTIHINSADTAPAHGTVALYVQFGSINRPEGYMLDSWNVAKGTRIDAHVKAPAGHRARLWYQPDGSDVWYLLPSQYWQIDVESSRRTSMCENEYGVSADNGLPSYHTHFANAIKQSDVPILRDTAGSLNQCGVGSATWRSGEPNTATPPASGTATPSPTRTPIPTNTPAPTATPCISLESIQSNIRCR